MSTEDPEKYIQMHRTNHTYDGIPRLMSFNVDEGSIVIHKDTVKYEDENYKNSIFYEVPFNKGDPTNGYNIEWTLAFINKNKNKNIKLLTVGSNPKLEYVTIESRIHKKNGKSYIKLNKLNNLKGSHLSPIAYSRREPYYSRREPYYSRREPYYSRNYNNYCDDCRKTM